ATSKWGLAVADAAGDATKTIDVGATPRKTLFSPSGAVGGSTAAGNDFFNAGGVTVDIAKEALTGGGVPNYINNYSAIAAVPYYNVVATADITVTVTGTDLSAFDGGHVWLHSNSTCTG